MAFESDVRQQKRALRDAIQSAKRERNHFLSDVDRANQWWKGKGGEAFIQEIKLIDDEAVRFLQYLEYAADGMERLPALILRAEQEQREKASRKN